MWRDSDTPDPVFTDTLELDLGTVEPSLAGPKRPQDRVALSALGAESTKVVQASVGEDISAKARRSKARTTA